MNDETTAQVTDLVQRYKRDEKGVMSYKKEIDAILKREGGIVKRKLRPRQVATHFDNRDKKMISVGGMYERAGKLLGVGFDIKVLEEEACTIEDHPMTREIAKRAIKLYDSDSRFAQLHEKDIEVGSVGGPTPSIGWLQWKAKGHATMRSSRTRASLTSTRGMLSTIFASAARRGLIFWSFGGRSQISGPKSR